MKNFNHCFVDIKESVDRVTLPEGRTYSVKGTDEKYPSITAVLGHADRGWLQEWRHRVGVEEANRIGRVAAKRGTGMHNNLEKYILNKKYDKKMMPNVLGPFKAAKAILDDYVDNIHMTENYLFSRYLKIAGQVDLIAEYQKTLSIIDFKSSRKIKKKGDIESYFKQACAYAIMFEERTGIPISQLVIIIATDGLKRAQVFIEKRDTWVKPLMRDIDNYYKDKKFGLA